MKIALLFFGQPRFLSNPASHHSHLSHIINKYLTDVFVHSWWSTDRDDQVASSWSQLTTIPYDRYAIKHIRELYNPVHAVYEPPVQYENDMDKCKHIEFIKNSSDLNNMKSHLRSIKRVGEVFREYTSPYEYKFIVLSRFDNIIEDLEDLNGLDKGFYRMSDHPGVADQLFVFSPEYFKFLDVFDNFDILNDQGACYTLEKLKEIHFKNCFPGDEMTPIKINLKLARS